MPPLEHRCGWRIYGHREATIDVAGRKRRLQRAGWGERASVNVVSELKLLGDLASEPD